MGRYIQQNQSRSELQQRIAADLRAKAASKAKQDGDVPNATDSGPDGVDDAAYLKGTKATTTLAPVWAIIFGVGTAMFGFFVYLMSR